MNDNAKIFFSALLIGLAVGALAMIPWLMTSDVLVFLVVLSVPGFLVGLVLSGGNIHSFSDSTIYISNFVFYPLLAYIVLYLRHRARALKGKNAKLVDRNP